LTHNKSGKGDHVYNEKIKVYSRKLATIISGGGANTGASGGSSSRTPNSKKKASVAIGGATGGGNSTIKGSTNLGIGNTNTTATKGRSRNSGRQASAGSVQQ
jgi:hypothetical protein